MKTIIFMLLSLLVTPLMANELTCYTPRMARKVVIKKDSIAISKPHLKDISDRALASISSVRTKYTQKGFEKIVFTESEKHTIHIEDKNNLNDVFDYLVVKNQEGHEVIYPLDCE